MGINFKKHSSEGDQLLAGAFHAIIDKIEADILQRSGIKNKSSYIKNTFFRKMPAINDSFAPKSVRLQV